jgi:RNA polymerase sigma factor (sigma-70 family)
MGNMLRDHWSGALVQQLERLFRQGTTTGLTEGELIERFVRARDESAFEALMARHGPMVLGVCRQMLRNSHDVDDAFQATFLVLVRKAGTLRRCDLLGNWLYGVAHRVASRSRSLSARRLAQVPHGQETIDTLDAHEKSRRFEPTTPIPEPRPWLHEELGRLPEKYRIPVVLCYFEGLTHDEAARRLGCPLGTVKGRLTRARALLSRRLTHRGVTLSATALAAELAASATQAAVPDSLAYVTLKAAQAVARAADGVLADTCTVSLPALTLAEGVSHAMNMTQVRAVALPLLVLGTVTAGVVGATFYAQQDSQANPPVPVASVPAEPPARIGAQVAPAKAKDYAKSAASPTALRKGAASPSQKNRDNLAASASPLPSEPAGAAEGMMGGGFPGPAQGAFDAGDKTEFENRMDIAQLGAALAASDKNPKNQALRQRLQEPIAMSFSDSTPLQDVIKYLKSASAKTGQSPVPIYVDPVGLQEAEQTPSSPITLDLEGVPLSTSLRLLLKQLGLAYCIRDGVVIISSFQGIREELAEAAREILGAGNEDINIPMMTRMGIFGKAASIRRAQ